MQYQAWSRTWLTLYVQPTVKIRTYEKYQSIVRKRILPRLGEYDLDTLTVEVLQKFVIELCETLSPNTVNGTITVLRKSLKTANAVGVSKRCFVDGVCRPKLREKRVECFTLSEQRRIEKWVMRLNKPKTFGIVLCLYTGLRIGELLALKWTDIDLQKGLLSVTKSCHYGRDKRGEYRLILEQPKTAQSVRVIPLPKPLVDFLKAQKERFGNVYVLEYKGKAIVPRSYQNTFSLLLKKLRIPHKGFHSLRHTFATRALECGMDVKTLSELLGHKNPTVTLQRYCHCLIKHKTEMMQKLGKFCKWKTLETEEEKMRELE